MASTAEGARAASPDPVATPVPTPAPPVAAALPTTTSAPDLAAPPVPAPAADGAARRRRRRVSRRIIMVAAGVVAAAAFVWWLVPDPLPVEAHAAQRGPLETTVDAEGVALVRDRYEVAAPVTGRLQRITLRAGDYVPRGALVARIAPVPLDASTRARATAQLDAALAAAAESRTQLDLARSAYEQTARSTARLRAVFDAGAISRDEMERADLQLNGARSDLDAAIAHAAAAAAGVDAARAALVGTDVRRDAAATALIHAPAAGRVLRILEPSERVVAAGTPLLAVGDPAQLEVVVDVLSSDAVTIAAGALMRLRDWGGVEALTARVRTVEPQAFTRISTLGVEEQRVRVVGDLLDAGVRLGDGYRVQAQIVTWQAEDVLRIPNSALFRRGTGWSVFVVQRERAALRDVHIGHRGSTHTEIASGLAAGEQVILFPSDRVRDGQRVRVTTR